MEYSEGLAKLAGRARLATIVLWVFAAVALLTAGGRTLEALGEVDLTAEIDPLALVVALVYLAWTVTFFVSIVCVGRWIYRAHANLADAGVDGLGVTPGWAVGWYFVPLANLVMPFQAMRELWTASHAELDPFSSPAPGLVKAWWAAWITGLLLSSIGERIATLSEGDAGGVTVGIAIDAVGAVGMATAAVLLTRIIRGVTDAQRGGSGAVSVFA